MKKIISLMLVLAMLLCVSVTAFAVTGNVDTDKGTITINKYNEDNIYSIYRMLILKSFNTEGQGTYSYVVNDGWEDFFSGEGAAYITVDSNGYVTWKTDVSDTLAPEFAKKALAYADAKDLTPDAVSNKDNVGNRGTTVDGYPTYTFEGLDLGYYLVDSTMGALCGLTTTNLHASINAKNGEPTLVKQVKEDSSAEWVAANTADIGQTVEYRVTITVQAGAQNYVLHDTMAAGLTFDPTSVSVIYDGTPVTPAGNYDVLTDPPQKVHSACTFEIKFSDDFCDTLAAGKSLIVHYNATLNENASVAGDNPNTATLEFGEDHLTEESSVNTKTYAFDLVKTDSQNNLLDGAKFKMYRLVEGVYELANLVKVTNPDDTFYYRPAKIGETPVVNEFEVEGGIIRFQGFDPDDYYFEETVAPNGYNMLKEKVMFTLSEANKDAIFNSGVYSSGSGFHITNQSGTMLPETGALGTMMFITFGVVVMIGTGVLLVTKKRMNMIRE